ncbi:GNAT family N-acetyltransferase [Mumia zhuanghuii]|uniref:GNAT family N-acetyltransferase n=2 Tax=Mumia TaxID=1546255 RepID=A0ABW1QRC6_9ACTN|nr:MULTISPECIES: GNAT family N-acetyltransferase [Mumia]KAA1420568.1 GNAT family N-acetyltransferase [Mumia zhuanghuii]
MLSTTTGVRVLREGDLPALQVLIDRDPIVNLFVDHRAASTRLSPRWLGGEIWGYFEDDALVSACHVAANMVPVEATAEAVAAFAERARLTGRLSSSIVGPRAAAVGLWERVQEAWGPARSLRLNQPFLQTADAPLVTPDPRLRAVLIDEVDVLYPASVAMFEEEVGESPELPGRNSYRARVTQLVARGWAYAIIEDGEVLFKAEVGSASAKGCQIQGVYVAPQHRGKGLGTAGMAAVVERVRREVAPVVSLYVNDYNHVARAVYERVGFVQTETFASVLF